MRTYYRGWIPAVTGRLSFTHFGDSRLRRTTSLSRHDGGKRYLIVHQNRKIWDVMLPSWSIFEHWLGLTGKAHFICSAETFDLGADEQACLRGRVYVISEAGRWQCNVRRRLREAFEVLDGYSADTSSNGITQHFAGTKSNLDAACAQNCAFQVYFCMQRSGILDIVTDSTYLRCAEAPEYPGGNLLNAVTAQVFSFLRDVGHKHQHHYPSTDTIVDLHEITTDDFRWRRKTLYSIYRRIITFKRQSDIVVQIRSVGLLAYAKAFKKIWLEDRPFAERECEIPAYFDDAMQQSIQSSELRMRFKSQHSNERWNVTRTVTISLLGLIISFASLIRLNAVAIPALEKVTPSNALIWAATAILRDPVWLISITCAVIFFLVFVVFNKSVKPREWRLFQYIQPLLQPYRRRYVFLITTVAAAFIIWLGASVVR